MSSQPNHLPRAALVLATGLGLGYLPVAPGTWGSLGSLVLYAVLQAWIPKLSLSLGAGRAWMAGTVPFVAIHGALILLVALVGVWAAQRAARHFGLKDPGPVVIDEVSGQQLAFLGFGGLLHVRALEAVAVAVVAGMWWLGAGWKKLHFKALATTCIVGLAFAGLYLAYNKAVTGDAYQVPINKYDDKVFYKGANRLGFGPDVGNFGWTGLDALPGHGPIDVIMNTNQNVYLLNFEMFGWASGSLLFVFLFLLLAWRKLREDGLMCALVLSIWLGMSLYWFSGGPDFGARYWYLMIVPLAVLTVRGAHLVAERFARSGVSQANSQRVWMALALATLLGVVNLLPWRSLDKYHNYRGTRPDIRKLESQHHFGRSLILIQGRAWPDYASAVPFNPPGLEPNQAGPIYARDLGIDSDNRIRSYYSDRPVWIVAGPSVTGKGFEVIEHPLSGENKR